MWFLVGFLLLVIAGCAWAIFELTQTKNQFKKHAQDLSDEILRMSERGNKLKVKIVKLKIQNDDLKHKRDSVDHMIKLGFLKVIEDATIPKDKIVAEMSKESEDSNVIYLGRHT